jgi:hypothetical protein
MQGYPTCLTMCTPPSTPPQTAIRPGAAPAGESSRSGRGARPLPSFHLRRPPEDRKGGESLLVGRAPRYTITTWNLLLTSRQLKDPEAEAQFIDKLRWVLDRDEDTIPYGEQRQYVSCCSTSSTPPDLRAAHTHTTLTEAVLCRGALARRTFAPTTCRVAISVASGTWPTHREASNSPRGGPGSCSQGLAALAVVEHFDVLEERLPSRRRGLGSPVHLRRVSVLSELKKLSAGALSQQLPRRLMLTAIPRTASSCRYIRLEYWLPRSLRWRRPGLGRRCTNACSPWQSAPVARQNGRGRILELRSCARHQEQR